MELLAVLIVLALVGCCVLPLLVALLSSRGGQGTKGDQ